MNIDLNFLFFDYIVIILIIIITFFSFWKGFINSVLGLLTWVGSVLITIYTYEYLSNYLNKILLNINFFKNFEQIVSIISIIISIPLLFLLSLFILKRIRRIISSDLDKQILGLILDKFFGAVYGIVFAYVVFSSALFFTSNDSLNILNNLNTFFKEHSIIMKQISEYNNNILDIYNSDNNQD